MNKISIIIPVYNSERYIRKCIESVTNQTYKAVEILLINDGSTDSSAKIIDNYASKDKRIIAIHKENGGIGSAYKAAFKVMTGDYILFVDSDDWLELNAVEELVKLAKDNNADMVSFGIKAYNSEGEEVTLPSFKNIDLINTNNETILKTHFEELKHPTLVRLYKRELFNDIIIFEQNIGIDEMLTPQLLLKCTKAVYTSKTFYNILARPDSVCRQNYSEKKITETLKVHQFLIPFFKTHFPQYLQQEREKYLWVLYDIILNQIQSRTIENKKLEKKIVSEFRSTLLNTPLRSIVRHNSIKVLATIPLFFFFPLNVINHVFRLVHK